MFSEPQPGDLLVVPPGRALVREHHVACLVAREEIRLWARFGAGVEPEGAVGLYLGYVVGEHLEEVLFEGRRFRLRTDAVAACVV